MAIVSQEIAAGCWLAFCVVWLIGALSAKRNIAKRPWWFSVPFRLLILLALLFVFGRFPSGRLLGSTNSLSQTPAVTIGGAALCVIGIGYAMWARLTIGRNWGMPVTLKEGHELVTTGPYAQVRHPIYGGILLAMLGSTLALSAWWGLILVLNGAQFMYAAYKEEQLMLRAFPDKYPAYRQRTKMLIPYVF